VFPFTEDATYTLAMPFTGLGTTLRLTKRVRLETRLYRVDERLANRGKTIFDVAPTRDGNRRLSIYAAFDFKGGKGFFSRSMWRGARLLFPAFIHDVVWDHALCTIKEEVERNGQRYSSGHAPLLVRSSGAGNVAPLDAHATSPMPKSCRKVEPAQNEVRRRRGKVVHTAS